MKKITKNENKKGLNDGLKKVNFPFFIWFLIILTMFYMVGVFQNNFVPRKEFTYSEFYRILRDDPSRLRSVVMTENILQGDLANGSKFFVNIPPDDKDLLSLLRTNAPDFVIKPAKTLWINILFSLGPVILFIGFLWYFSYRGA